jgi:hypothetical protein
VSSIGRKLGILPEGKITELVFGVQSAEKCYGVGHRKTKGDGNSAAYVTNSFIICNPVHLRIFKGDEMKEKMGVTSSTHEGMRNAYTVLL